LLEFGDRHGTASTCHQLGILAQGRGRFDEAEHHYLQALELKVESGDQHGAALTYGQLGVVAQERGRLDEAEHHFHRSLELFLESGDRHGVAVNHYNLGSLAREQRRFDDVENHYRQALQVFRDAGDERTASLVATSVGRFLAETGRHVDAFAMIVDAAVSWWRLTGSFDRKDISLLSQERWQIDDSTVRETISGLDPAAVAELTRVLDQPEDS
jgi:tetratricopeptide (TPR) repeat protein